MSVERAYSLVVEPGQWAECDHRGTVPMPGGGVELGWTNQPETESCSPPRPSPAASGGLAFDRHCQAYRSRVRSIDVIDRGSGEMRTLRGFQVPRGLAVDHANRLYVADPGEGAVRVLDLSARRLLRRIVTCGAPVDVAPHCGGAVVLVPGADTLFLVAGRRGPAFGPALVRPCYPRDLEPIRVAKGPLILWRNSRGQCVITQPDGTVLVETVHATDVDVSPNGTIVVAGRPGDPFLRFAHTDRTPLEPVGAPDYDGGAIAVDPKGQTAYTTASGIRWTIGSVAKHVTEGTVVVRGLDSQEDRTRWGRIFFSACLPKGTSMSIRAATTADTADDPEFIGDTLGVYRQPDRADATDDVATYEAPVLAPRGRYLWLEVTLSGTERVTPRLRTIRVERPGHTLLDSLPRAFSRDEGDAEFLFRMLAPTEGMLHEVASRAARRAELLDPATVRADLMPWLASFMGLVLDPRWPESARRILVAEAYELFRYRGTVRALRRMAEIYLDRHAQIIERWQLRGIGGTVLGTSPSGPPTPNFGSSVRETGTLGRFAVGGTVLQPTSFDTSAHRFTLLVPGTLTDEQRAVLTGLLQTQAPAHTVGTVQELGAGMRVGTLRVGITSFVGPTAEWTPARVGEVRLGGNGIVGTPAVGSRLGQDSYAGQVLVG